MRHHSSPLAIWVCLATVFLAQIASLLQRCLADELSNALEVVDNDARNFRSASWRAHGINGRLSRPGDPHSPPSQQGDTWIDALVKIDYETNRYRLELASVGGTDPPHLFYGKRQIFTHDGGIQRTLQQREVGKTLPQTSDAGRGAIAAGDSPDARDVRARLKSAGMATFGPYFMRVADPDERILTFSQLLRESQKQGTLGFATAGNGNWKFSFPDRQSRVTAEYSPELGLVVGAEWDIGHKMLVEPVAVDGFHVPKTVIHWWPGTGIFGKYEFSDISLNRGLEEADFLIDFPVGTYVVDYVAEKQYEVSRTPINERQAVADFMTTHKLSRNRSRSKWGPALWGSAALVGGILVLAAVFYFRQYRKAFVVAGALLLPAC